MHRKQIPVKHNLTGTPDRKQYIIIHDKYTTTLTQQCFPVSAPWPAHLVAQLQAVEGVGGVRVEGLGQVAQGEGEVARQVRVAVQAVLQGFGQDGVEHQRGQQLPGGLAAAQLSLEAEPGGRERKKKGSGAERNSARCF